MQGGSGHAALDRHDPFYEEPAFRLGICRLEAARTGGSKMTYIVTRIDVGDYDAWKPMFDSDPPGARQSAKGHRVLRGVENPNEVFVVVEFASPEDAAAARAKLLASRVLDRFEDKDLPKIVEEAETVTY